MKVKFENDFQFKVMSVSFEDETVFDSKAHIDEFKKQWLANLASWHSPYKAVVDLSKVRIGNADIKKDFEMLKKFLDGFFLKKVSGFGYQHSEHKEVIPFEVFKDESEAKESIGIRKRKAPSAASEDFRSAISIENHFKQHCVEVSFKNPVILSSKDHLTAFKSKMTNNLMQWHSPWNLLIDCTNLDCKLEQEELDEFNRTIKFFNGFFLKKVIGYSPMKGVEYPFKAYRSRHKAAADLEQDGAYSGDTADCLSRKS